MNNNKVALWGLVVFVSIALIAAIAWKSFQKITLPDLLTQTEPTVTQTDIGRSITEDAGLFHLEARYLENSKWEYTVTAQLPTPCDGAIITESIKESYPEQVTIQVTPTTPAGDVMCAQVIQNFSYDGTFQASEQAKVGLNVDYRF